MIKLSVNETKWSSLLARTSALILFISIWIFDFGPVKLPGLSRNRSLWRQLFERWIALFTGWISIHWIAQLVSPILIRWVAIYPVDSTIHLWTTGAWSIKDYLHGQKEKIFSRTNAGSPERARWVHLACWGSQSEHTFRFILPAHEFSLILGTVKIEVTSQVHFA